jgi:putative ATPase
MIPLAAKLRPKNLNEFMGQEHLIGKNRILRKMIESDKVRSLILFGPPGTGKTTLAKIIAHITSSEFYELNATDSGIGDVRKLIKRANTYLKDHQKKTIVFIDEIHRWNKAQQDALLPSVETGTIILIGATTLNPYFSINGPLLSRSELFEFKHLNKKDLIKVIKRCISYYKEKQNKNIIINKEAAKEILERCGGDGRKLCNIIEILVEINDSKDISISIEEVIELIPQKHVVFDASGEERYDGMSAVQGSIQASDPHSAVYWLAWCINRGEDLNVICRRLLVSAAEDVGLCDPQCLPYVTSSVIAAQQVGLPEAAIILSSAVSYMAMSPRSKASANAIWTALKLEKEMSKEIPRYLKDSHYKGADELGRGKTKDGRNLNLYEPIIADLFVPENGNELSMMKENDEYWKCINNKKIPDEQLEE